MSCTYHQLARHVLTPQCIIIVYRYFSGGVCRSKTMLLNKTVIITGANTGIGRETAIDLAKRQATVIIGCRNPEKGRHAEEEIRKLSGSDKVFYRHLDLASLTSVHQFAEQITQEEPQVDILINNAGVYNFGSPYEKTEDGFEMHFGVNYLGHFLLTNLLLDSLKSSPSARIISVTSTGYVGIKDRNKLFDFNSQRGYSSHEAYNKSKLAIVLSTRHLAKKLEDTNVTVNCLHPGLIFPVLAKHLSERNSLMKVHNVTLIFNFVILQILMTVASPIGWVFFKSLEQGAQTSIYCAVSEEIEGLSGKYFADCQEQKLSTVLSQDDEVAEVLWNKSLEMIGGMATGN